MARDVLIPFYDPAAASLAAAALRAQLVNPDGTPSGALVATGFAQVNGTADQFLWSGTVGNYFEGVVQFKTDTGRVLGSSDLPTVANDNAKAVWEYALESGADASAAIGYVEQAANAAATAANEAKAAAQAVTANVLGFELSNGTIVEEALVQAAQSATEAAYTANQAKLSADQAARVGAAMTLTSAERNATADAILDRAGGVEAGLTLRQTLRIVAAVLFGKAVVSGNHVDFKRRDGTTSAVSVDFTDTGARPISTVGSV